MMLDNLDLYYKCVDIDYNLDYDCENSGCDDDGICRCGTINDAVVTNVKISKMTSLIYDELFDDNSVLGKRNTKLSQLLYGIGRDINMYTIDRVLRKYKIWEPYNFNVEVFGGFYGQEIEGVFITKNIASKIIDELDILFSIENLSGRIEYLLSSEYGILLPELTNCQYEIIELDKTDISFGSIEHHNRVKKKDLEFYNDTNYNGIRGIVKFTNGKYRLIDGYHRVHTTAGHKVKVLKAFK